MTLLRNLRFLFLSAICVSALIAASFCVLAGEDGDDGKETWSKGRAEAERRIADAEAKFNVYRAMAAAEGKVPAKGPGRVVGFVIDATDGSAPKGVEITAYAFGLGPESTKPGGSFFEVIGLLPRKWHLQVTAHGYRMFEALVDVVPGEGEGMGTWVVFRLERWPEGLSKAEERIAKAAAEFEELRAKAEPPAEGDGRVLGFVIDEETGEAPEGASVHGWYSIGVYPLNTACGDDGSFALAGLKPMQWHVGAAAPGYAMSQSVLAVNPGQGPGMGTWAVFRLKKLSGLEAAEDRIKRALAAFLAARKTAEFPEKGYGRVVGFAIDGETGEIPGDAAIVARPVLIDDPMVYAQKKPYVNAANPREDGSYGIDGLHPGEWEIEANAFGYVTDARTVAVKPGQREGMGTWVFIRLKKDDRSKWSAERIEAEERIAAAKKEFEDLRAKAEPPAEGKGRILGYIIDSETGVAPGHARITVISAKSYKETVSDETGAFEIADLEPRDWTVKTKAYGYKKTAKLVTVKPGQGPGMGAWVVFRLEKLTGLEAAEEKIRKKFTAFLAARRKAEFPEKDYGRVLGFVIDAETGEIPEDAAIVARPISIEDPMMDAQKAVGVNAARPQADGYFNIRGLQPGEWEVEANAFGYVTNSQTITVKRGQSDGMGTWVVFRLEKDDMSKWSAGRIAAEDRIAVAKMEFEELRAKAEPPAEGKGRILGYVIYAETGEPPAQAGISVSDGKSYRKIVDYGTGTFEFKDLEPRDWYVSVEVSRAYKKSKKAVTVIPGQGPGMGTWVVFRLEKLTGLEKAEKRIRRAFRDFKSDVYAKKPPKEGPGRVVGFVIDAETGEVPEDAAIVARAVSIEDSMMLVQTTVYVNGASPQADGYYAMEGLQPGEWEIEASAFGYVTDTRTVAVKPGHEEGMGTWVVIKLKKDDRSKWPAGRIEAEERIAQAKKEFEELRAKAETPSEGMGRILGYIIDAETGEVPAQAGIAVSYGKSYKETDNDEAGAFEFGDLPCNVRWYVRAGAPGYKETARSIPVKPGQGPGMGAWVVFRLEKIRKEEQEEKE